MGFFILAKTHNKKTLCEQFHVCFLHCSWHPVRLCNAFSGSTETNVFNIVLEPCYLLKFNTLRKKHIYIKCFPQTCHISRIAWGGEFVKGRIFPGDVGSMVLG